MLYCSRSIHLCFDLSVEDQETVDTLLVSHREQLWKLEPWIAHHGLGHAPPAGDDCVMPVQELTPNVDMSM